MPLCVWLLALWHLKPFCKPPQSPPTTSHPCLLRILPTSKNNNNGTWKQILLHQEDSLLSQLKDDCQRRVVYNNMLNLLSHYSHLHMVGKAFFCGTLEVYIKLFHVAETSHCWVAHIPFCALYAECDSGIKAEKEKKTLCVCGNSCHLALSSIGANWMKAESWCHSRTTFIHWPHFPSFLLIASFVFNVFSFFEFTHCNSHSVVLFMFWLLFQMHTCNFFFRLKKKKFSKKAAA